MTVHSIQAHCRVYRSESRAAVTKLAKMIPSGIVPRTLRSGGLVRSAAQVVTHMFGDYGWLRSMREGRSVNRDGQWIPWFTYPAIDFLSQFDYTQRSVFEYGSGASTLFWASRARCVVSVESEADWCAKVRAGAPANCEVIFSPRDPDEYSGQIRTHGRFDVVVIDGTGESRPLCCWRALEHLEPGGMIILDNSDLWLRSASILREAHLIQVDFTGFAPLDSHAHTTSVFLTRDFAFEPLQGQQPHKSVAQPEDAWTYEGPEG